MNFLDTAFKMGMIDQLVGLLSGINGAQAKELITEALLAMATNSSVVKSELRRPELKFSDYLHSRIKAIEGKDAHLVSLQYKYSNTGNLSIIYYTVY